MDERPLPHEHAFYELMWRAFATGAPYPLPWWVQQYFRRWSDEYDGGLFGTLQGAFASNAQYRYWNMVGVKDAAQETLVGQAGEIEPVYDKYALGFFLFDPATRALAFPERFTGAPGERVAQGLQDGYLPIVVTRWASPLGLDVEQRVFSTVLGPDRKVVTLARFEVSLRAGEAARDAWLCLRIGAAGPSGLQRHDRAGRYLEDGRISWLRYLPAARRVEVGTSAGPVFDLSPAEHGLHGGATTVDPDHYLRDNPFASLAASGHLNGRDRATDTAAGLCTAAFAWPLHLAPGAPPFRLDVRLPVDDYRAADDFAELSADPADLLEQANWAFWTGKLDRSGLRASFPAAGARLHDLARAARAQLLILADGGQIHPGPTIYDSFWIRDSSIEGIAAALAGDGNLAERQFGWHYPGAFHLGDRRIGPVRAHGFFGGRHEEDDREWDSNGQALWAIGRFDRIRGRAASFGARMFTPFVSDGARWLRDNRDGFGLLHAGWSAEHLGDKHKPHYWDDLWAVAGLWEAARLAERIGAPEAGELWAIHDDVRRATADSIRWALGEQRRLGHWETFIPTGPADVGRRDSTMVGAVAYFHPCRLHVGAKLGADVDWAARQTLETIWGAFVTGGFRHDSAWRAYGPYLTLQLAHAFLLIGDVDRMERCLAWSLGAGTATVSRADGAAARWQVVAGAWNEQHCYPVASDFAERPGSWWYMGDIPHGWAAAELLLLARDMLLLEGDEDASPHLYVAPGIPPAWLAAGERVTVSEAPTTFGAPFGYELAHDGAARRLVLHVTAPAPPGVSLVLPVRHGGRPRAASADGAAVPLGGSRDVWLPPGTRDAWVEYE
jgi:hypothetical protein